MSAAAELGARVARSMTPAQWRAKARMHERKATEQCRKAAECERLAKYHETLSHQHADHAKAAAGWAELAEHLEARDATR